MSEELTVSVREEVIVFLNSALAAIEGGTDLASMVLGRDDVEEFYVKVKSEIRGIIQDYVDGGKESEPSPAEIPVKVGDRVRVLDGCASAKPGLEFKVKEIGERQSPYEDGINWYVEGNKKGSTNGVWVKFIEVIEPKSDASKIEAGDLVRLTGEYWDEHKGDIYTITSIDPDGDPTFHDTDGTEWFVTGEGYAAEIYKKASEL